MGPSATRLVPKASGQSWGARRCWLLGRCLQEFWPEDRWDGRAGVGKTPGGGKGSWVTVLWGTHTRGCAVCSVQVPDHQPAAPLPAARAFMLCLEQP